MHWRKTVEFARKTSNDLIVQVQGLAFQALHQHFVSKRPQIYHLRGRDEPAKLARRFRKVVEKAGLSALMPSIARDANAPDRYAGPAHRDEFH